MTRLLSIIGLVAAIALISLTPAPAQPPKDKEKDKDKDKEKAPRQAKKKDLEGYRKYFKKPESALEFYEAMRFEIDVGKFDLAASYLHNLLAKMPGDDELAQIGEMDGISPILALRKIRKWSDDAKENKTALADAEEFIKKVTDAVAKRRNDADRIRANIKNLSATPEERDYAMKELYKSGAAAIPYLIDTLRTADDPGNRLEYIRALKRMGRTSVPPLLAALDSADTNLKLDVLDILRSKHAAQADAIVPHLWYPSASPKEAAAVRKRAREMLAAFLDTPSSRLPRATLALNRLAEKYLRHKIKFPNPTAVPVWRWDEKTKTVMSGWPGAPTVTAAQAEEYWGLRFAGQALDLDPTYRPAQVVFLTLATDAALDRTGLAKPLSAANPKVNDLLAKANNELILEVLERAIKEKRTGLALTSVQVLGDRAEVKARRPIDRGEPALIRALCYPDRRVQFAAAEALLRIPGPPTPRVASRIVEVLGRALATDEAGSAGRRVMVAIGEEGWRDKSRAAVEKLGFQAVGAGNARDVVRLLRGSDFDAILLDSTLPGGLPWLLAQLRADSDAAGVPIFLAAVPETRSSQDLIRRFRAAQERLHEIDISSRAYRDLLALIQEDERAKISEINAKKLYTAAEKNEALQKVEEQFERERADAAARYPQAVILRKDVPKLEAQVAAIRTSYDREAQVREEQLKRFTARNANVRVVPISALTGEAALREMLLVSSKDSGPPLTGDEQKAMAERAIVLLADLAQGKPPGYNVAPAAPAILTALRSSKFSPEGQLAAIRAAGRLSGANPQSELANVILDNGRTPKVRTAAASELIRLIQKNRLQVNGAQLRPLFELAEQPKLDPDLRTQLVALQGSVRGNAAKTGERLREYRPTPVAPLPPPKE
jgi:hypothetical protein